MATEYKDDIYKAGVGHEPMDEHLAGAYTTQKRIQMSTLYKHTSVHIYVGIKAQYDEQEKLDFYAQVMGDGTDNIHFGRYSNIYVHMHTTIHIYMCIRTHISHICTHVHTRLGLSLYNDVVEVAILWLVIVMVTD